MSAGRSLSTSAGAATASAANSYGPASPLKKPLRRLEKLVDESRKGYQQPTRLTVAEYLLERWLPRTRTSVKTRNDREMHMRCYVTPRIGGFRLIDLTGDELTEMYDDLAVRGRRQKPDPVLGWGLSPTTIRRIHTQLHKAFTDAIRWGLLSATPATRPTRHQPPTSRHAPSPHAASTAGSSCSG